MKTNKLLVFDYDGVIVRSHELILSAIQHTSRKMRVEVPSVELLQNTEARALFKLMKLGPVGAFRFVSSCRNYLAQQKLPDLIEGMRSVFEAASDRGFTLGVVSPNRVDTIQKLLERESLLSNFDFIEGGISLWGKEKTLWELSRRFQPLKALYVGDEERDIISGKAAGFGVVAVSWGVKSAKLLKTFQPTYFVDQPLHLTELLGNL